MSERSRSEIRLGFCAETKVPTSLSVRQESAQKPLGRQTRELTTSLQQPPGWVMKRAAFSAGVRDPPGLRQGFSWAGRVTLCLYKPHQAGLPGTSWMGAFLQNSLSVFPWTITWRACPASNSHNRYWNDTFYGFNENGTCAKTLTRGTSEGAMLSVATVVKTSYKMSDFKRLLGHLEGT